MNIADNCVVSMHYTLTDDMGAELDSSLGQEPFAYMHGTHSIIPGLERALTGRREGETLKVTVQPSEGYGEIDPELIQRVPREAFAGVADLQEGMQFQSDEGGGRSLNIIVREVGDEEVIVDANHPLAGRVLHFDVRIEAVREADPEEIAHGHIHP
ncbi:MAG: peptidylprolyl isomerase [Chromatiales bacterium]|jgi:FKBP-type peptidyl-prolyl cis-trans isomerase SlyD|nr:peptidylprolyl isomerase [Chromatiales bacterium]